MHPTSLCASVAAVISFSLVLPVSSSLPLIVVVCSPSSGRFASVAAEIPLRRLRLRTHSLRILASHRVAARSHGALSVHLVHTVHSITSDVEMGTNGALDAPIRPLSCSRCASSAHPHASHHVRATLLRVASCDRGGATWVPYEYLRSGSLVTPVASPPATGTLHGRLSSSVVPAEQLIRPHAASGVDDGNLQRHVTRIQWTTCVCHSFDDTHSSRSRSSAHCSLRI